MALPYWDSHDKQREDKSKIVNLTSPISYQNPAERRGLNIGDVISPIWYGYPVCTASGNFLRLSFRSHASRFILPLTQ